jgi:hypothetical protein
MTIPTAVTDGQAVDPMCSKGGKLVTDPYGPREMRTVSGLITLSASTTETTLVAAGGSGVFLDLSSIKLCNTSASDARVDIRDATAGTVVDSWFVQAGRCVGQSYPFPIPQTTANNAWTVQSSASVTDLRIKASFAQSK